MEGGRLWIWNLESLILEERCAADRCSLLADSRGAGRVVVLGEAYYYYY
jgi:hypothetical protein